MASLRRRRRCLRPVSAASSSSSATMTTLPRLRLPLLPLLLLLSASPLSSAALFCLISADADAASSPSPLSSVPRRRPRLPPTSRSTAAAAAFVVPAVGSTKTTTTKRTTSAIPRPPPAPFSRRNDDDRTRRPVRRRSVPRVVRPSSSSSTVRRSSSSAAEPSTFGTEAARVVVPNGNDDEGGAAFDAVDDDVDAEPERTKGRSSLLPLVVEAERDLDPMLSSGLLRTVTASRNRSSSSFRLDDATAASRGLSIWSRALRRGRCPTDADFSSSPSYVVRASGSSVEAVEASPTSEEEGSKEKWPKDPLFAKVSESLSRMELPRLALRHPEIVSAVLLTVLRLAVDFAERSRPALPDDEDDDEDDEEDYWYDDDDSHRNVLSETEPSSVEESSHAELEAIAADLASDLEAEWGGASSGLHSLDALFGSDHGLLDVVVSDGGSPNGGFGTSDGVWSHVGFRVLPSLQRRLSEMPELTALLNSLGKRPSASERTSLHKFPRQISSRDAPPGIETDPTARETVAGLTLSSSLTEMLPSEAALLKSSREALRLLFLAKKAESKLMSYEHVGYADAPSTPDLNQKRRRRRRKRYPSAPGGPIAVCLDTSHSMSGSREILAKSVVVASVTAARKQNRSCRIVAFSSTNNVMDSGSIGPDRDGVLKLLDFLGHSFGGGTDVSGALRHVLETLSDDDKGGNDDDAAAASGADVLLVTDGELPNPPAPDATLAKLERWKKRTGSKTIGLLLAEGKKEESEGGPTTPLEVLCDEVHDFLSDFDGLAGLSSVRRGTGVGHKATEIVDDFGTWRREASHLTSPRATSTVGRGGTAFFASGPGGSPRRIGSGAEAAVPFRTPDGRVRAVGRGAASMHARRSSYDEDYDDYDDGFSRRKGRTKRRKKTKGRGRNWDYDDYDDDGDDLWASERRTNRRVDLEDINGDDMDDDSRSDPFHERVSDAISSLRSSAASHVALRRWNSSILDDERSSPLSCWKHRSELRSAVETVSSGLVERDAEARIVVLGLLSSEHVLLLGPPGTGKSALGRRLSRLCGGPYFQRLLTRFTTPEEIFGPLSLRSLENDEYRRVTEGYLPSASVAFLDEIFKSNSAILNALLTILNERTYDNGGGRREACPVKCVVGASNELPESDELDALYDRFLLRMEVRPVSDEGLMELLGMTSDDPEEDSADGEDTVFCLDEISRDLSSAADDVTVGTDVRSLLRDLRTYLRSDLDSDVSDRRLAKAARLLRISAASDGRNRVDFVPDCLLLEHVAWHDPDERGPVKEWLWDHLTPGFGGEGGTTPSVADRFRRVLENLRSEAIEVVRSTSGDVSGRSGAREPDLDAIRSLRDETIRVADALGETSRGLARHVELLSSPSTEERGGLWIDEDEASAAAQVLLPRAARLGEEVDAVWIDAIALEMALDDDGGEANGTDDDDDRNNDRPPSYSLPDELRVSVVEGLWADDEGTGGEAGPSFTEEELDMGMRDAKRTYDADTFRRWKRARKKR